MNKRNLASIVIVSWNGLHWLQRSLPTVFAQDYSPFEVILVDNASEDGTVLWVKKNFPMVKIVSLSGNEGYAEANNRGYEISGGEYVLFLNNDVEVTSSFLRLLLATVETDDSVAGAQSKILLLEDRKRLDTIGAFLTPTGFLYHYAFMNLDKKELEKQIYLYTPKGACMLFKRRALEQVKVGGKLFDSEMFAYFEETDLAHRIWLSGKRIIYSPASVIYHKMGGTSAGMNTAFIQYHSFKNRLGSYIKNVSLQKLIPLILAHLVMVQLYVCTAVLKGKLNLAFEIEKALLWNVFHLPALLKKRRYIQSRIRKVSDNEIWPFILRRPPFRYYLSFLMGKPFIE